MIQSYSCTEISVNETRAYLPTECYFINNLKPRDPKPIFIFLIENKVHVNSVDFKIEVETAENREVLAFILSINSYYTNN